MLKKLCSMTAVSRASERSGTLRSEKGSVLVIVIVLSAVALAFMTALLYMITSGTKVSGLQKRYKTALDAGEGGGNVFYSLVATRADPTALASLNVTLNAAGLNYSPTTPLTCTEPGGKTGLSAKLLTPSTSWVNCDTSLNIDPAVPSTYDMKVQVGTNTKYDVYAKIVAATKGNTGGDEDLINRGVIDAGTIAVQPIPFYYAIEVVSENSVRIDERAKLSILYQY